MTPSLADLSARDLVDVAQDLAREACATLEEVFSRSRQPHLVRARRRFYQHLRNQLGWSYPAIGAFVGRDHTTILNAFSPRGRPEVST